MRMLGKKMIVHRGEVFDFSANVYQNDGVTPFVLSSDIVNPYLVIAISSSNLAMKGRYRLVSWLDLSTYPSFRRQTPEFVEDSVIESNTPPLQDADGKGCIYYTQDSNGNKTYYWYNSSSASYEQYSFSFHKQYLNSQTRQWIESIYQYELSIVGGQLTTPILTDMYKSVYPTRTWIPTDAKTLYDEIKKCNYDLVKNVRWSSPLINFYTVDILQRPESLIIKPNC